MPDDTLKLVASGEKEGGVARGCRRAAASRVALAEAEPFKTVPSGDQEALAKLTMDDLLKIAAATLFGMGVETYGGQVTYCEWNDGVDDARAASEVAHSVHRAGQGQFVESTDASC